MVYKGASNADFNGGVSSSPHHQRGSSTVVKAMLVLLFIVSVPSLMLLQKKRSGMLYKKVFIAGPVPSTSKPRNDGKDKALEDAGTSQRSPHPSTHRSASNADRTGDWKATDDVAHRVLSTRPAPCGVPRVSARDMTTERFNSEFRYKKQVIITGASDNTPMKRMLTKQALLKRFGNLTIDIFHPQMKPGDPPYEVTMSQYVDQFMAPWHESMAHDDVKYMFGGREYTYQSKQFQTVLRHYNPPKVILHDGHSHTHILGLGGSGSGIVMHDHTGSDNFAEVIYGQKRWFFVEWGQSHKYASMFEYPFLFIHELGNNETFREMLRKDHAVECITHSGEVMYVPNRLPHLVINIGETVSVNTVDMTPGVMNP